MKTKRLLLIISFLALLPLLSFAQEKPKLQYAVGFGLSHDSMNLLYGLNFTNELNFGLGKRTSLNAGLTFYQSLGNYEKSSLLMGQKSKEQYSGIFITPSFKYDIIQSKSGFNLAIAAGPSLQLGGETFLFNAYPYGSESPYPTYVTNKYQRVGLFLELEAEWNSKNPNRRNAVSLSAFGANNAMPWYLHATYKVRFKLGKK
ncbi:hypothetical protein [Algoriphagus pacificus]|uniref:Outer membrane protein beta-barrel domain-containing protein n=1 Tax=Algoriphagus pacificus TaxID=2811234 RepID=A0ABS3CEZ5_9BACT|nr:hypothetical protein [Algoriphagus pacificus]MBN7815597.1 hypothetical protein [Algoriphagus pacificus]